jgi:DNA-directed RNA polymerase specialized sigma24 family protein
LPFVEDNTFLTLGSDGRWSLTGSYWRKQPSDPDAFPRSTQPPSPTIPSACPAEEQFGIHDALECLARDDPQAAQLVKLRYFAGLSIEEAAEMAGLRRSSAYEHWAYARAWLRRHLTQTDDAPTPWNYFFSSGQIRRRWRMD